MFVEDEFESVLIEIQHNGKPCILGEIYRIPNTNGNISI